LGLELISHIYSFQISQKLINSLMVSLSCNTTATAKVELF
jgi:hypothetical protein